MEIATDPPADIALGAQGQSVGNPSPHFGALDLVALHATEKEAAVQLVLQVQDLDNPVRVPVQDDSLYVIDFLHLDQGYRILVYRYVADQDYIFGILFKEDLAGETRNFVRYLPVAVDAAAGTMSMSLSRDDLLDRQGASPFPGRTLSGFTVESHLLGSQEAFISLGDVIVSHPVDATDRMPDSGAGKELPFTMGLVQSGHAVLWSLAPTRGSNGEEATFVFNVSAQNTGTSEDLFEVRLANAPAAWNVTVPDRFVRIAPGATVAFPVIVSTPFAHQHGLVQKFTVEMHSTSDQGTVGRVALSIRYHSVPQPAGHHPDLFFHTARYGAANPFFPVTDAVTSYAGGFTYMNTLESDPQDQKVRVHGYYWGTNCGDCLPGNTPRSQWRWFVYLSPGLEMGLDFDLTRNGTLSVPIQSKLPLAQAVLGGRLMHESYDDSRGEWTSTLVAELAPSAARDLEADTLAEFSFEVKPTKEADLIRHAKRPYLTLALNLTSARPALFTGAEAPDLAPGGKLNLPLLEYRDPVDPAFASVGAVRLDASGQADRVLNAGKTALYALEVTSHLDHDQAFDLAVGGIRSGWAQVTPAAVTVPAGGTATVHVAVQVPATALKGDLVDLIVTAQAKDTPGLRALARLTGIVDPGQAVEDEAALVPAAASGAPAPAMALVAGALALAALASRRRHA